MGSDYISSWSLLIYLLLLFSVPSVVHRVLLFCLFVCFVRFCVFVYDLYVGLFEISFATTLLGKNCSPGYPRGFSW